MNALSVPGVSVNNVPINIVPNSFSFKMGKGEITVRSASSGGGSSKSVHTEDAEMKIGEMKFEMYVTEETLNLFSQWKKNIGTNAVSAVQPASTPLSGSFMSCITDSDFKASADGTVEMIFRGDPLSDNF